MTGFTSSLIIRDRGREAGEIFRPYNTGFFVQMYDVF